MEAAGSLHDFVVPLQANKLRRSALMSVNIDKLPGLLISDIASAQKSFTYKLQHELLSFFLQVLLENCRKRSG